MLNRKKLFALMTTSLLACTSLGYSKTERSIDPDILDGFFKALADSENTAAKKKFVFFPEESSSSSFERLTQPTASDPFITVVDDPGNFEGWKVTGTDNKILFILDGDSEINANNPALTTDGEVYSGFDFSPVVDTSSNPTGAMASSSDNMLTVATSDAQVGFTGWRILPALSIAKGQIYRARLELSFMDGANLTNSNGQFVTIRFGNPLTSGVSITQFSGTQLYNNAPGGRDIPRLSENATAIDTYLVAKAAAAPELTVEVIDQASTGENGFGVTISGYSIDAANRASLGAGTTLVNYGGPVTGSTESMQVVEQIREDWTIQGNIPGKSISFGSGLNQSLPKASNVSGDLLQVTHGPEPASSDPDYSHWEYTRYMFAQENFLDIDNMDTGFDLTPGRLYFVDLWASTNSPGETHPMLGLVSMMDGGFLNSNFWWVGSGGNPDVVLQETPRVYTTILNPDPNVISNATAKATINISFLHCLNIDLDETTIRIHRLILTEYAPF